MRICPKCGQKDNNNAQYCTDCGEPLIEKGTNTRKEKPILWIFAVLGVSFILAGAILVLNKIIHTENIDSEDTTIVSEAVPDSDSSSETITESEEKEANSEDIERRSDEPMELTDSWTDIAEASNNGTYKEK